MKVFIAGTEDRAIQLAKEDEKQCGFIWQEQSHSEKSGVGSSTFKEANILQSFYYCNEFTEKGIIPNCKSFMLDSGAFTFMNNCKKNINWYEYIDKYVDFINRNKIDLFFELDIDVIVGYEEVKKMRKYIERKTNKKCIPVWHKSRGLEEYKKLCKEYSYIAIGGIVTKEIKSTEYKYFSQLIKIAHENKCKVHGLGFTKLKELEKYKFDSVDSSSWVCGNRFGFVYLFDGKTLLKQTKNTGQRLKDGKEVALHNFKEWVKFSKYAEHKL